MTGPSRSSPWGIQRGKEIPETIKKGTKHQNKKPNKTKNKTRKEEKGSKYKENQRGEKTCWKKKKKALVYPCQNQ